MKAFIMAILFSCSVATSAPVGSKVNLSKSSKVKKVRQKVRPKKSHYGKRYLYSPIDRKPKFDIPITYNKRVQKWINYYQGRGHRWLTKIFSRSYRYFPSIQYSLHQKGLPLDLAYIAIIESGLSPGAVSSANAVGYWQFIKPTAERYGLKVNWWVDERRDFYRSTLAAANYLGDLYKMFGSWYLAASAYNMGENRLKRLIKKYKTNDYWILSKKKGFPKETRDYIPKLIATVLIAKAPKLYGFKKVKPMKPHSYEVFHVPGGTDLFSMVNHMGLQKKKFVELNPSILKGFIPRYVKKYRIRIPKGYTARAINYVKTNM